MTTILIIVILLLCAILGFFVLVQKPKGNGLSGSFGSIGAQVMGVQKSGDTFEKGTWYTMAAIAVLSIATVYTIPRVVNTNEQQEQTQENQAAPQDQSAAPNPIETTN